MVVIVAGGRLNVGYRWLYMVAVWAELKNDEICH